MYFNFHYKVKIYSETYSVFETRTAVGNLTKILRNIIANEQAQFHGLSHDISRKMFSLESAFSSLSYLSDDII